jgi:hypothetical protein
MVLDMEKKKAADETRRPHHFSEEGQLLILRCLADDIQRPAFGLIV